MRWGRDAAPYPGRLLVLWRNLTRSGAQSYLASGDYYWSSFGMFMFRAKDYLSELAEIRPDILGRACTAASPGRRLRSSDCYQHSCAEVFSACPDESGDNAVMEKTADAGGGGAECWTGAMSALRSAALSVGGVSRRMSWENVDQRDARVRNSQNCCINGDEKLVAAVGVEDYGDCQHQGRGGAGDGTKSPRRDVKKVVEYLKSSQRESEYKTSPQEIYCRPWGAAAIMVVQAYATAC